MGFFSNIKKGLKKQWNKLKDQWDSTEWENNTSVFANAINDEDIDPYEIQLFTAIYLAIEGIIPTHMVWQFLREQGLKNLDQWYSYNLYSTLGNTTLATETIIDWSLDKFYDVLTARHNVSQEDIILTRYRYTTPSLEEYIKFQIYETHKIIPVDGVFLYDGLWYIIDYDLNSIPLIQTHYDLIFTGTDVNKYVQTIKEYTRESDTKLITNTTTITTFKTLSGYILTISTEFKSVTSDVSSSDKTPDNTDETIQTIITNNNTKTVSIQPYYLYPAFVIEYRIKSINYIWIYYTLDEDDAEYYSQDSIESIDSLISSEKTENSQYLPSLILKTSGYYFNEYEKSSKKVLAGIVYKTNGEEDRRTYTTISRPAFVTKDTYLEMTRVSRLLGYDYTILVESLQKNEHNDYMNDIFLTWGYKTSNKHWIISKGIYDITDQYITKLGINAFEVNETVFNNKYSWDSLSSEFKTKNITNDYYHDTSLKIRFLEPYDSPHDNGESRDIFSFFFVEIFEVGKRVEGNIFNVYTFEDLICTSNIKRTWSKTAKITPVKRMDSNDVDRNNSDQFFFPLNYTIARTYNPREGIYINHHCKILVFYMLYSTGTRKEFYETTLFIAITSIVTIVIGAILAPFTAGTSFLAALATTAAIAITSFIVLMVLNILFDKFKEILIRWGAPDWLLSVYDVLVFTIKVVVCIVIAGLFNPAQGIQGLTEAFRTAGILGKVAMTISVLSHVALAICQTLTNQIYDDIESLQQDYDNVLEQMEDYDEALESYYTADRIAQMYLQIQTIIPPKKIEPEIIYEMPYMIFNYDLTIKDCYDIRVGKFHEYMLTV